MMPTAAEKVGTRMEAMPNVTETKREKTNPSRFGIKKMTM